MTALNFHSLRVQMKQQMMNAKNKHSHDASGSNDTRINSSSSATFRLPMPSSLLDNFLSEEESNKYRVGDIPSVFYIPNFMTRETESLLLKLVCIMYEVQ